MQVEVVADAAGDRVRQPTREGLVIRLIKGRLVARLKPIDEHAPLHLRNPMRLELGEHGAAHIGEAQAQRVCA